MKTHQNSRFILLPLLMMSSFLWTSAQSSNIQYSPEEDTASLDNIISAVYDVISGEKGNERNWNRFLNLFHEDARLIPNRNNSEGQLITTYLSPTEYIERSGPFFEQNGFYEHEIGRKEQQFGSIAHVWSAYESRYSKSDVEPFARGINSMQLKNDGKRWWIINIYWTAETADNPIPEEYLSN